MPLYFFFFFALRYLFITAVTVKFALSCLVHLFKCRYCIWFTLSSCMIIWSFCHFCFVAAFWSSVCVPSISCYCSSRSRFRLSCTLSSYKISWSSYCYVFVVAFRDSIYMPSISCYYSSRICFG